MQTTSQRAEQTLSKLEQHAYPGTPAGTDVQGLDLIVTTDGDEISYRYGRENVTRETALVVLANR